MSPFAASPIFLPGPAALPLAAGPSHFRARRRAARFPFAGLSNNV
jgi:hypothetical protein